MKNLENILFGKTADIITKIVTAVIAVWLIGIIIKIMI